MYILVYSKSRVYFECLATHPKFGKKCSRERNISPFRAASVLGEHAHCNAFTRGK